MVSSNRSKMANSTNCQDFQNHPPWTAVWEVWHCRRSSITTTKTTTRIISKLLFFGILKCITALPRAQSCFTNVFKLEKSVNMCRNASSQCSVLSPQKFLRKPIMSDSCRKHRSKIHVPILHWGKKSCHTYQSISLLQSFMSPGYSPNWLRQFQT